MPSMGIPQISTLSALAMWPDDARQISNAPVSSIAAGKAATETLFNREF